ncbi:glycosyltransferase family 52 [Aliivibrio sp. S10_S31]|uniref:glycosyltransferase family 52 n=1 Tax=Aliivibrio sp. S10_S31 TaxID=2720224 RepID=UPI0016808FBC|nr:glycosyltransferase family 52 [Aliivibrio sp. S10_S31]MBD1571474.1 hypothetical protein [Aliivibrio sp. S10_S31]
MKISNLIIVDSVYSIYLYSLIRKANITDCLFIVSDGIPKVIRDKIPNIYYIPSKNKKYLRRLFSSLALIKFRLKHKKATFIGHDHLFYSYIFLKNGFILLEDGSVNFKKYNSISLSNKVKELLIGSKLFGFSNKIKKIYLTDGAPILEDKIKKKVELINIKNMFDDLSDEGKERIKKLFSFSCGNNLIIDRLLITQPFSEDGRMTENEKVAMYIDIMKTYSISAIKPHPRELTDYSKYTSISIIPSHIPFQLIQELVSISEIISLSSTANNSIECKVRALGDSIIECYKRK